MCCEYANKVCFAVFKRHRPANILPFTSHKYIECLCEYWENFDLKLKALNATTPPHLRIQDRYSACHLTLCPKENDEYKRKCLDRECIDCGVTSLSHHLHTVLQADRDMPVVYYQWQREVGGGKTQLVKATHRESFSSLVQALEKDLLTFAVHLFNARWQAPAYKAVTTNCPPLFCKDFAEELYMQAARRTTGMSLERHAVRHPPSCGNIPLSG